MRYVLMMQEYEKKLLAMLQIPVKDRPQGLLSENNFWFNLLKKKRESYVPPIESDDTVIDVAIHFGSAEHTSYYPDLATKNLAKSGKNLNELAFATAATNRVADHKLTKSILRDLNFPINMVNHRHAFYTQYLSENIREKPKAIMEIGGGAGLLMSMLTLKFKPTLVIQIDIPEMLIQFAATFKTRFGDEFEFHVNDFPKNLTSGRHVVMLENGVVENFLPQLIDIDLSINTHSLQEMSMGARNFAVLLLEDALCQGGHFFNVNWIQERMDDDGKAYFNNPLAYPYNKRFDCVDFREDPFQSAMRCLGFKSKSPSLAFLRFARKYLTP